MRLSKQIKIAIGKPRQCWSAINTLVIAVIIITPLCGLLFQCGCDWPWSGLDSHCNFYKPYAQHHCPWCASMTTGVLSTGLAIIAGVLTAIQSQNLLNSGNFATEVSIRTTIGIVVLILIAILSAAIAALLQAYPLGIGRLILPVTTSI